MQWTARFGHANMPSRAATGATPTTGTAPKRRSRHRPGQHRDARDRDGTFDPQIVRKHQGRLGGVNDMVLSLSTKGLTAAEISAHLSELYGTSVSKDTISAITDRGVDRAAGPPDRCAYSSGPPTAGRVVGHEG